MITILTVVYVCCALLLVVFGAGQLLLLLGYLRFQQRPIPPLPEIAPADLPTVTVQLPVYNERYVVAQLLQAVAALDYPRDKLLVQVLDDSTDDTSLIIAEQALRMREQGIRVEHVRRPHPVGYKAGALGYGMTQLAPADSELLALFDADFVPPPDFLLHTVPYLVTDAGLGLVQARWGHLNADMNLLTRSQAIKLDAHFMVEQIARNRAGWLATFNGTGGVWRRACIEAAGGWSHDTLTEDMDLSYRAQMQGWRFLIKTDPVVPGEVPPSLAAYKRQQSRWAKGCTQCFLNLTPRLVTHPGLTPLQRFLGIMHTGQYISNLFMLLMLLLTPPLVVTGALLNLPLAPMSLVGVIPILVYTTGQIRLYGGRWWQRMLYYPAVMVLDMGMSVNNTRAVLQGLTRKPSAFLRTPKFAGKQQGSVYALRQDNLTWVEGLLALYALLGALLALWVAPFFVPYLLMYGASLGIIAVLSMREVWRARRTPHEPRSLITPAQDGLRS